MHLDQSRRPRQLQSAKLRYYTGTGVAQAVVASPDRDGGCAVGLQFDIGKDAKAAFVAVTVPGLEYWNLVYFTKG